MNMRDRLRRLACALACAIFGAGPAIVGDAPRARPAAGVNLAGAEFGEAPGAAEKDFHFPADSEFAWAKSKGFAVVRLPFLWERLQPALEKDFDGAHLALLTEAVDRARAHGLAIILDVHNYGRWRGDPIGGDKVPDRAFADLWRRLAQKFGKEPHVVFGLMNEPHDMQAARWAKSAQAAIDAIRGTGACNLLLVPGVDWTGAHSWAKDGGHGVNAQAMRAIHDRGAHAFEFHQYLDDDSSGRSGQCRKTEEVVAALSVATGWLRENRRKGFLGEFGAGNNEQCRDGLDAMLAHMADNADVWLGWAYWAAGAWWPKDYPLSIEPKDGEDRPQMKILAKWTGAALPGACPVPKPTNRK
ncbi:MAG TPA: glycoside hydrolase family 5 protein [Rhodoblastus sp.]|nr:glycoside hydrolase family 5 protein [Rhodoblastus sp.]